MLPHAWSKNPFFDCIKQDELNSSEASLISKRTVVMDGVEEKTRGRRRRYCWTLVAAGTNWQHRSGILVED